MSTSPMPQGAGPAAAAAVSRKVTACAACRKQKIKCHMPDASPPCTRCRRRGLSCSINRSLQMILESDAAWKQATEDKIKKLESALSNAVNSAPTTPAQQSRIESLPTAVGSPSLTQQTRHIPTTDQPRSTATQSPASSRLLTDTVSPATRNSRLRPRNHWDVVMDSDSGPAAIPGSVVHQLPDQDTPPDENTRTDLIARGVVTLEKAQQYFDIYTSRLDHFLYRILGDDRTLPQVRTKSSLLTAAIVTVGALHAPSSDFEACLEDFTSSTSAMMFMRNVTTEEVRALLIGAFWLSGISWALVGMAVRVATEISLHKSIYKALQGDRNHYLRTRLYYLVYVCDHHFSIVYGRPPMTQQDESIQTSKTFLTCTHATEDDARLVSQVEFWTIGSYAFQTFGVDQDKPLADSVLPQLRKLIVDLDAARARWSESFSRNCHVGNYPKKGVALHSHFAKLYLFSHALRGIGRRGADTDPRSPEGALEIDELAGSAVLSAKAILRTIVSDPEFHAYLNGLATYFDIMIAFAVVFLLKMSTKHSHLARPAVADAAALVADLAAVLARVTAEMHPAHLLVSVARGVDDLLARYLAEHAPDAPTPAAGYLTAPPGWQDGLDGPQIFGIDSAWNSFDLVNDLDFLRDTGDWAGDAVG